jgi:hypothetical protein
LNNATVHDAWDEEKERQRKKERDVEACVCVYMCVLNPIQLKLERKRKKFPVVCVSYGKLVCGKFLSRRIESNQKGKRLIDLICFFHQSISGMSHPGLEEGDEDGFPFNPPPSPYGRWFFIILVITFLFVILSFLTLNWGVRASSFHAYTHSYAIQRY